MSVCVRVRACAWKGEGVDGDVQVLALSLGQMAGSWIGLDSLRSQAQVWLSLQVRSIVILSMKNTENGY